MGGARRKGHRGKQDFQSDGNQEKWTKILQRKIEQRDRNQAGVKGRGGGSLFQTPCLPPQRYETHTEGILTFCLISIRLYS